MTAPTSRTYQLEDARDKLAGMSTYIDGKMKRYSLLFAVNGGAFVLVKWMQTSPQPGVGGLTPRVLAVGAVLFTVLMWRDIYLFGAMMRDTFFNGELVFARQGRVILAALSLLLIAAWLLAAFWPRP
jgi:hypothetical protein